MDPQLEYELSRLDPSIPFRASQKHVHHTWAKTFHSYPELYIQPQSIQELQKVVTLARRCRKRLVVVGSAHSPSHLTCTSSWMLNLDGYNDVISVDKEKRTMVVQSGIRLRDLGLVLAKYGLTMPNLGSIDNQSIAGAISTATHGSSLQHGILSQAVIGLKIMLANGSEVFCNGEKNPDLFRAGLVSLGLIGIITEVTVQAAPTFRIEWAQQLKPLDDVLERWDKDLWTQAEFTRCWWLPYMRSAIVWRASKTDKPYKPPRKNFWGGFIGYHTYQFMLYVAQWFPRLLPSIEWFVINTQYGFKDDAGSAGVEDGRTGLLMDCLYNQFVNEWALPLDKGPEAIRRLGAWLNHEDEKSGIPLSSKGVWVHAPIEVRVADTSFSKPRPFLDNTVPDGPTLFLNATLYRPYHCDPPCRPQYYKAFEWLMKDLGARPHWAKNFYTVTQQDVANMYPEFQEYLRIRDEVDPDGMFVGEWHRQYILPQDSAPLPLEEKEVQVKTARSGGIHWYGERAAAERGSPIENGSEESFDLMHGVEAGSVLLEKERSSQGSSDKDSVQHGQARRI